MLNLDLQTILLGAAGLVSAVFGILFKMRGNKINDLEKQTTQHKENESKLTRVIETQKEEVKKAVKVNEILNSNDSDNDVIARLRNEAATSNNGSKE